MHSKHVYRRRVGAVARRVVAAGDRRSAAARRHPPPAAMAAPLLLLLLFWRACVVVCATLTTTFVAACSRLVAPLSRVVSTLHCQYHNFSPINNQKNLFLKQTYCTLFNRFNSRLQILFNLVQLRLKIIH
jgi:hypothetical protein